MMQMDSETRRMLLDLHLAEYNVQATRITYWITLQYATYTLAAVGISILVQALANMQPLTLSLTVVLLGQLFILAMLHVNQEMFTNVFYIEKHLKAKVQGLLQEQAAHEFWHYETMLADTRKNERLAKLETFYVLPACLAMILIIGLLFIVWAAKHTQTSWGKAHSFWLLCDVFVLMMVAAKLPQVLRLQRSIVDIQAPPADVETVQIVGASVKPSDKTD